MGADVQILGRAVKQLQHRHHRALDAGLAVAGTTLTQWDALRAIGRSPGASAHALAVATFQSDQAFGTLANRLVGQGLVARTPGRGRRIDHHLTQAGERVLAAGHPIVDEILEASFAGLSEIERTTLLALILRITGDDPGSFARANTELDCSTTEPATSVPAPDQSTGADD